MRTRARYGWVAGLLLAGCYSPSYHDGDLQCTSSDQCPKDYHCAVVDHTCWHNGRDPDAGLDLANADAPLSPDAGSPGNFDSASVTVPLDQLASAYATVVCAKNFACCTQADLKGKSLATCESNTASALQPGIQAITDGIAHSRTIYNADRASRCLQGIAAVDCSSWPMRAGASLPAGCDAVVLPQVASGGACLSVVECTTGFCSGATSNTDGTCLPRAANGDNCTPVLVQNSCQDGLFCDSTNLCSAVKDEGATCTRARECISQTCGVAATADAGASNVCLPAVCYSTGPFLAAGCSMGGRPAALPGVVLLIAGAALLRRRWSHSLRRRPPGHRLGGKGSQFPS
jgi:hypothetical protein